MAPTNRSLFPSTGPVPGPDPCAVHCNLALNPFRFCPPTCIPLCPAFCQPLPTFFQPPPPPSIRHHQHRLHDLLSPAFIAMFVLLTSAFIIAVSYLIYSVLSSPSRPRPPPRHISDRDLESDQSTDVLNFHPAWYIATVGLQRSAVESIAVCEYKTGDGLVQGTGCTVCLAEFRDGDLLRLLPKCCHAFHVPCIDTWLASHTTCPVCRAPVVQAKSNFQLGEAVQAVEIVDSPSSSGEVVSTENSGELGGGGGGEAWRPMRRAASMDSLCVELDRKVNASSSGCNSLVERSHSCTGKLFSSSSNGLR